MRLVRASADLGLRLLLGAALAIFLLLALLPHLGLYRPETVLSGSMKPYFSPGDMIVVTPEPSSAVKIGQVISYHIPVDDHHVQTHRVVQVLRGGEHPVVRTKGDANNVRDPWTARLDGSTVWRVRLVVPKLGWMVARLRDPLVRLLTVFVAPALFAIVAIRRIWNEPDHGKNEEASDAPSPAVPLA